MTAPDVSLARRFLSGPLRTLFDDPSVREIHVNGDGKVFIHTHRGKEDPNLRLTPEQVLPFLEIVASSKGETFTEDSPLLNAELPDDLDRARLAAVRPPISNGPALTLRKHPKILIPLSAYVTSGILTDHHVDLFRGLLADRRTLLIAGGTDTGKTTLANALLGELAVLSPDERVVILEDTQELRTDLPNALFLRTNAQVTLDELLRHTLRLHPDRIIVGEVRGPEAFTLLDAMITGHPGGIATVHADTADGALLRLSELAARHHPGSYERLAATAINAIVLMRRVREQLTLHDLVAVDPYLKDGRFQVTSLL